MQKGQCREHWIEWVCGLFAFIIIESSDMVALSGYWQITEDVR